MITLRHASKLITHGIAATVIFSATAMAVQASTLTYQLGDADIKDVWVQPTHAGVGDTDVLHVWKSSTVGGFKSLYEIPGLIGDIASLDIGSATLNLYVLDTEGGSHSSHAPGYEGLTVPVEVSAMANSWLEDPLVGGTPAAIDFWDNSVSAIGGSSSLINISGADVGNWISFDVTDIVNSWIEYDTSGGLNGLAYYGFLIEALTEVRASDNGVLLTAYNSSGFADAAFRPYLEVTAVPLPAAIWLFGSALFGLIGFRRKA
jgi:hypothetical protein